MAQGIDIQLLFVAATSVYLLVAFKAQTNNDRAGREVQSPLKQSVQKEGKIMQANFKTMSKTKEHVKNKRAWQKQESEAKTKERGKNKRARQKQKSETETKEHGKKKKKSKAKT